MARTHKTMGGMDLLNKAAGMKKRAEGKLQSLGFNLAKGYSAAKKKAEASPRYKKAQERAMYEGAAGSLGRKQSNTFKVGKKKVPYRNDNQKNGTYPKI